MPFCLGIVVVVVVVVVVVLALYGSIITRRKYKGTFSMNCKERGSDARSVYPTQYTSRMGTARVKHEIWKEGMWAL